MEVTESLRQSQAISVRDQSHVGEARRLTIRLASDIGMGENDTGTAALVATELASNLAKYATSGQIVIRPLGPQADEGVEILSLDSGPGIADLNRHLADGYSSGRTPGNGLGAVIRQSSQFDIYSHPGIGTGVMARIASRKPAPEPRVPQLVEYGVVSVPMAGERRCGDGWRVHQSSERVLLMLVDGLGHGDIAHEAAIKAAGVFDRHSKQGPGAMLSTAHERLRETRGAVMAVLESYPRDHSVVYAGVGNISACTIDNEGAKHMASVSGTVGYIARPKEFRYSWSKPATLVMMSDGINSRWRVDNMPGLLGRHPSLVAGMLYQLYNRGRDDATVLAAKWIDN